MAEQEILELTQRLLDSIAAQDWSTYKSLTDESLTCFEPEALGQLVEGLAFHKFYFDLPSSKAISNTTMASPHVRIMGNVAVVSYVRLIQRINSEGKPQTFAFEETRVWEKKDSWLHVHFHRSAPTKQ